MIWLKLNWIFLWMISGTSGVQYISMHCWLFWCGGGRDHKTWIWGSLLFWIVVLLWWEVWLISSLVLVSIGKFLPLWCEVVSFIKENHTHSHYQAPVVLVLFSPVHLFNSPFHYGITTKSKCCPFWRTNTISFYSLSIKCSNQILFFTFFKCFSQKCDVFKHLIFCLKWALLRNKLFVERGQHFLTLSNSSVYSKSKFLSLTLCHFDQNFTLLPRSSWSFPMDSDLLFGSSFGFVWLFSNTVLFWSTTFWYLCVEFNSWCVWTSICLQRSSHVLFSTYRKGPLQTSSSFVLPKNYSRYFSFQIPLWKFVCTPPSSAHTHTIKPKISIFIWFLLFVNKTLSLFFFFKLLCWLDISFWWSFW